MDRRQILKSCIALLGLTALPGCSPRRKQISVAAHPWPGYELLYIAREIGRLDPELVKMIETPTATANIRALGGRMIEAACLTLDEVLTARERGIPLTVAAVLDVSMGADVLLAKPHITGLNELRGRRVAVEHSALGALMLQSALSSASLGADDVRMEYFTIDEHEEAYLAKGVDAVVTYEPVKTRLLKKGARKIFSSAEIPGKIIDVLAFRTDTIDPPHADAIREAVQGHFRGLHAWNTDRQAQAGYLAKRLSLTPDEVIQSFSEIQFPDIGENIAWFSGSKPRIVELARELGGIMHGAGLLTAPPDLTGIADGSYLMAPA